MLGRQKTWFAFTGVVLATTLGMGLSAARAGATAQSLSGPGGPVQDGLTCTVWGGPGNDTLVGQSGDVVCGLGGNDTLVANGSNVTLIGGPGNDKLTVASGGNGDVLLGDDGNDTLTGGPGTESLYGGNGNDKIVAGSGTDTLSGGPGNDKLTGGSGPAVLDGGDGNDAIVAGSGPTTALGGNGNDRLIAGAGRDTLLGGAGNDKLMGGSGPAVLDGGDGADVLKAGTGPATLLGGNGNDKLAGSALGHDVLAGGNGNDVVTANGGPDDTIEGGSGSDNITGCGTGTQVATGGDQGDTENGGCQGDNSQGTSIGEFHGTIANVGASSIDVSVCEVDDVAQAWLTANNVTGTLCSNLTVTIAYDSNTQIERQGGLPFQVGDNVEVAADTSGATLNAIEIHAEGSGGSGGSEGEDSQGTSIGEFHGTIANVGASSIDVSLCEVDGVAQAWLTANNVTGTLCSNLTVTIAYDSNTQIERQGGLPFQVGDNVEVAADTSGATLNAIAIHAEASSGSGGSGEGQGASIGEFHGTIASVGASSIGVSVCQVDEAAQAWLTANNVTGTLCNNLTVTIAYDSNTQIERQGGLPFQVGDNVEVAADTSGATLNAVEISAQTH